MSNNRIRLIARLDVKGENVVKGVHLEGLRIVGKPETLSKKYYEEGIDEIIYIDSVASLYGRNNLHNIVEKTAREVSIPITVAGGIRNLDDIRNLLRAGADKVAINTQAVKTPEFIQEAAKIFGSQCIVLSIPVLKGLGSKFEVYTDNGREKTDLDPVEWAMQGQSFGAGEILLTSIDKEGTYDGFDLELINKITTHVSIPVVASGGAGKTKHLIECKNECDVSGIAIASILHYNKSQVSEIRSTITDSGISVRNIPEKKSLYSNFTKQDVFVIDYGSSNLFSVIRGIEKIGANAKIVNKPEELKFAEKIILPGVGTYSDSMDRLNNSGFTDALLESAFDGKLVLGICLGAQLLLTKGLEYGDNKGLGLIPGEVVPIDTTTNVHKTRVPHVGWNKLDYDSEIGNKNNPILKNIPEKNEVYFVHSYKIIPDNKKYIISSCDYEGQKINAIVQKDKIIGCQFHPEKSGYTGLNILENILSLN